MVPHISLCIQLETSVNIKYDTLLEIYEKINTSNINIEKPWIVCNLRKKINEHGSVLIQLGYGGYDGGYAGEGAGAGAGAAAPGTTGAHGHDG